MVFIMINLVINLWIYIKIEITMLSSITLTNFMMLIKNKFLRELTNFVYSFTNKYNLTQMLNKLKTNINDL